MEDKTNFIEPRVNFDYRLTHSENVFFDLFGHLSGDAWTETLVASIDNKNIDGLEFPSFPPNELQSQIHGHAGAHSIREASAFYALACDWGVAGPEASAYRKGKMLDFGSGWGRIVRPFMRDFPLKNIIGFEPDNRHCAIARANNPFVSFVSGSHEPPTVFNSATFDLIEGWSVFSHLSETSMCNWLGEFGRITKIGGYILMTTWGMRFLTRLLEEQKNLENGQDIHWYSKLCLQGAGDLHHRIERFTAGDFVWFDTGGSNSYGETFLSQTALERMLKENDLPLTLECTETVLT